MTRPLKYDTAKEAAEASLYSKVGGARMGLSLEEFTELVTSKCTVCGTKPTSGFTMLRKDDQYHYCYHHIVKGKPVCGTCRTLAKQFNLDYIVRHCARIMAKRMHDRRRAALSQGSD
jgi:hypothetical protein